MNRHEYTASSPEITRGYSKWEELTYTILEDSFRKDLLSTEYYGYDNHVSVDWATPETEGGEARVGLYRSGEVFMGIVVDAEDIGGLFWIRKTNGDLCRLADDELDLPIPLTATSKERRKLKTALKNTLTRSDKF